MQRLAQVAGWKQPVLHIGSAHQQNVDVAVKLPVLKPIVENVDGNALRLRFGLRQHAGIVSLRRNKDGTPVERAISSGSSP